MAGVGVQQLLIVLVTLVLSGVLVACPQMVANEEFFPHPSTISRWILSVLVFFGIVAMVVFLFLGDYMMVNPERRRPQRQPKGQPKPTGTDPIAQFLETHAHLIGIYIFGSASLATRFFYFLSVMQCANYLFLHPMTTRAVREDEAAHLVLIILHIVFFMLKMPFLVLLTSYRRSHTKPYSLAHLALLMIIAVDFADWVFNFMTEADIIEYQNPSNMSALIGEPVLAVRCLNHSTAMYQYEQETVKHVLFPMTLEFMLTSAEVILHVWLLEYIPRGREHLPVAAAAEEPVAVGHAQPEVNIPQPPRRNWYMYQKVWKWVIKNLFNVYTALVLGLMDAVLTKYYLLETEHSSESSDYMYQNKYVKAPMVLGRILLVYLPGVLLVCHCCSIMRDRDFSHRRPNAPKIQGSDVILILAAIGYIFLRFFQVLISIGVVIHYFKEKSDLYALLYALSGLEALLSIPQNLGSICLIYYGQRRIVSIHHPYYDTLQGALSFLSLFSFIRWGVDTFYEMEFLHSNTQYEQTYSWDPMVTMLVPLLIYFRYVCVILYLKVKKQMRMDAVHQQRLD